MAGDVLTSLYELIRELLFDEAEQDKLAEEGKDYFARRDTPK